MSKAETLRRIVDASGAESARLAALLTLARHYVDVGDGVKGFATASEARTLALKLGDFAAAAHALNSISISQYNRSEHVSAITTAIDARDYANRSGAREAAGDSYYSIGLALFGLGLIAEGEDVVARGMASSAAGEEVRVRLTRLMGILGTGRGDMPAAERAFDAAIELAAHSTPTQREACHALWAIAWIRHMDEQYAGHPVVPEKLAKARAHLRSALAISREEGDAYLVADRTALLGIVTLLGRDWEGAERLLTQAQREARGLDYVRAIVVSTVYLSRLYLERGDAPRAADLLRGAIDQARRGAADDVIVYARALRARALEELGRLKEAENERRLAAEFREQRTEARLRSGVEAVRLIAPLLRG
ncbi:MAG TPA: hypothetical protein VH040_15025 [Usitatibacter sp.]|nr:hypothetical protein [Usitatibacter sp.]